MKRLKHLTNNLKRFFSEDIWAMEMEELSKAKARFVKYVKVLIITIKTFTQQKVGPRATALSYLSMMAIVPFMAIVFGITGGLGLGERLKEFMYANISGNEKLIDTILSFAQNIIDTAQSGWMGFLSALLFIWIVFRLMMNVESAFNNVWKVDQNRSIVRRFSFYLAILLLAPFVIFVMFAGSFIYSNALEYVGLNLEGFTLIKKFISWCLFVVVQFFYLETQLLVNRLNGIYGTFAAVPLFMIWLNISWNIILIGAEVSYAFQHVDSYNIED